MHALHNRDSGGEVGTYQAVAPSRFLDLRLLHLWLRYSNLFLVFTTHEPRSPSRYSSNEEGTYNEH